MTSHDVRDMLDLPGSAAPRRAKKQKSAAPRPNLKGLAREVQSLGGDNPIAIVPEVSVFKKRRLASRKPAARWDMKPFKNSARQDGLILKHWRRKEDTATQEPSGESAESVKAEEELEDSTFAKFNVQVNTPNYDDEQYRSRLQSDDWTKDETDYLINLVREYDLRWPVIWDRYEYQPLSPEVSAEEGSIAIVAVPKERSMEDMKARYYSVAAKMMAVQNPVQFMGQAEFSLHELMTNFDPKQETKRKLFAEAAFQRTKDEAREEENLLLELKRILARTEKLNEERKELYARLEAPPSAGNVGIYSSSQGLQQLLQQLMSVDKSKKRKSLIGGEGMSPAVAGTSNPQQTAASTTAASYDRRDSSHRESVSGPSSISNNKKGSQAAASNERRKLTDEEERVYGVSHFDRLSGGPTFRHEKINRPINSKSTVQQLKISNVLTELEIPGRLVMPTAEVGAQFEHLLAAINTLLDSRKIVDKLSSEIQVAKAQKELKEKEKEAKADSDPTATAAAPMATDANGNGTGGAEVKMEDEREKSAAPSTRGAGAASTNGSVHKRSASVLSTVSDKSTKRQKK
ncbi:SWR1-complex protein 4 [Phlyctema vagabunda]|uniref:SWR1-complex protein 4 n=1 Tax=Phlyctema vagabunda TaxID=108571 RepID=A0ABR4PMQ2_9HELO